MILRDMLADLLEETDGTDIEDQVSDVVNVFCDWLRQPEIRHYLDEELALTGLFNFLPLLSRTSFSETIVNTITRRAAKK